MAWITITQDNFLSKLSGPELTAVTTKALAPGQANPIPEEILKCVREIRGRVAACASNTLGEGETIPDELEEAALAIIRLRVLTRLPLQSLVTAARELQYRDALSLLRDVAACEFRIEQPETASTQKIAKPPSPSICERPLRFTRDAQDGI